MKVIHDQILTAPPLDWVKVKEVYLHATGVYARFFIFTHTPFDGEPVFVIFNKAKGDLLYRFELEEEIRNMGHANRHKFKTLEEAKQKADGHNLDDLTDLLERYGVSVVDVPPPDKEE